MRYFPSLIIGAVVAGVAQAAPHERAASGLNTAAIAAGKLYFGSATDNPELTDTAYVNELSNTGDWGQTTPGNSMKWDAIEPSQNTFTYSGGDAIANLAAKNGQKLRCHNLVWHNQLPSWVSSGTWTNATLIAALKNHITNEVTHYKGKCYAWDVVNEALNDDGTYRSDVFYNTIGPAYIPIAFAAAAAADPSAKLYYNDYNIENPGAKSTAAQNIVKMIQAYGGKIDGVGLQSHFIVGSTPSLSQQTSNMAAFAALGVDVAITELDIRMTLPSTDALLAQQSTDYANTVTACLNAPRCVGITVWDYTDKYSWVPNTFSGQGAACPFDANLAPKPAYSGILSALNSNNNGGGGSSSSTTAKPTTSTTPLRSTTTESPITTRTIVTSPGSTASRTTSTDTAITRTLTLPPLPTETQSQWGQCGGIGWAGPTECASPWTCHVLNSYYSQCY